MNKTIKFLTTLLLLAVSVGAWADNVTDELTNSTFGVTSTTYTLVKNKRAISDAVYAANLAGGNNSIQLRSSNNNSGIVSTTSGGKLVSVSIEFNENTTPGRTVTVYGSNKAFTNPSELYGVNTNIEELGRISTTSDNKTITVSGDYKYVGIRSQSGALYLDKVIIEWSIDENAVATTTTIDDSGITNTNVYTSTTAGSLSATVSAGGNAISGATVSWSSSNTSVATIDENGAITLVAAGTATITASYAGVADQYKASSATYELTVTNSEPVIDYATLPFEYEGNGTLPQGFTVSGVGTYNSSPAMKFDGTGDYAILKINERPGKLTFDIKGNSFSGGTFKVQTSVDGTNYTDLESYTVLGDTQSESFDNLAADVRYIKWIYTNKSSGNVALGNIKLEKYVEPSHDPVITLDPLTVNVGAAGDEGTIAISYNNFGLLDVDDFVIQYCDAEGVEILEPDWIVANVEQPQGGDFVVSYVVEANDGAARTAYFKVYAMDGNENLVYSNLVTITQAAAPEAYTTIPALFEAATSEETDVNVTFNNWVVSGVSTNGKNVFVTDNNGNGFVIYSNSNMSSTYTAGNILSGTAVPCKLMKYNGFAELLNVNAENLTITEGGTVAVSNIAMADLSGVNTGALVSYEGLECSVNNNKYYLSDGTTTLQVYNALYNFEALVAGKQYNITGIYQQYNSTKEILPRSAADIVEVTSTQSSITLSTNTIEATADGANGTITVTYNNITDVEAEVLFFAADGTTSATYNWITADINNYNNVDYIIEANTGAARTAYMKVWAYDDDLNEVYSDLITITQAAPVIDYATLPFNWEGGAKADFLALNGVSANSLGSDYAAANAPYLIKLDGNGDYIQVKTDSQPGKVTIGVKMIGGATTSTITVQGSADGNTFTDVEALTISGDQNDVLTLKTTNSFAATDRYVRLLFTKGSNVGVGPIKIAQYVDPSHNPVIISDAGMATLSSENALDFTNVTTIQAYYATLDNSGNVAYRRIRKVPAETGLLIRNAAGEAQGAVSADVPTLTETAESVEGNILVAALEAITGLQDESDGYKNYILNKHSQYGLGFYLANGKNLAANRAYMRIPVGNAREFIGINFDGDATGIESIRLNGADDAIFDLQGRKVMNPAKGLYIVNGKKVVVK